MRNNLWMYSPLSGRFCFNKHPFVFRDEKKVVSAWMVLNQGKNIIILTDDPINNP